MLLLGFTARVVLLATLVNGIGHGSGVCDSDSVNKNASSTLLRGRHLVICEVDYPPFAVPPSRLDAAIAAGMKIPDGAPGKDGWEGMDFALFEEFSTRLGFTYEVQLREKLTTDTNWTSALYRIMSTTGCDLLGCYWGHTPIRREGVLFMNGHIDFSLVLIVRSHAHEETSLYDKLWTFLLPFHGYTWLALSAMTIVTGFVMLALERAEDRTVKGLKSTMYNSAASMLWGGFPVPTTAIAVPYQVVNAFLVLILVSACTPTRLRSRLVDCGSICPLLV